MTGFISDVKSRVEYIASIDTTTYDRYIVWIESSECDVGSSTLAEFIDGKLQDIDSAYRDRRNEDALKALVVTTVYSLYHYNTEYYNIFALC